jgi:hypothetical protein
MWGIRSGLVTSRAQITNTAVRTMVQIWRGVPRDMDNMILHLRETENKGRQVLNIAEDLVQC